MNYQLSRWRRLAAVDHFDRSNTPRGVAMRTKKDAQRAARGLKQALGPQWKTRVWENCGWNVAAHCGGLSVHMNASEFDEPTYFALMGEPGSGTGMSDWYVPTNSRTPRAAAIKALRYAQKQMAEWQRWIDASEKGLK